MPMRAPDIEKLPQALTLLLRRIGVIEGLGMNELVTHLQKHVPGGRGFETAAALFCAHYFAQAATLRGHELARHGTGRSSMDGVQNSLEHGGAQSGAVHIANDCRLSVQP